MKGTLPWAKALQMKKQTQFTLTPWEQPVNDNSWITTLQMKRQIPVEEMCDGCPIEFIMFLNYSRGLRFDELPDYNYLRKLFRDLAKKQGIEYDWKFDWLK